MRRLLWLSKETPDPSGQGGQRRQFHQIRELVRAGVDVEVLTLAGEQGHQALARLVPVRRIRVRRLLGGQVPDAGKVLLRGGYDRLLIAHAESLDLLRGAHRSIPVPWLVDFHNVNSRWYAGLGQPGQVEYWAGVEDEILRYASASAACSIPERAALLARRPQARVLVAGNGIDPQAWPDGALAPSAEPVLAAFGSWWYGPNREGLAWFLRSVWPQVHRAVPAARLRVAGTGDPPVAPGTSGVEVVGRVPDLAGFLGAARIVAVPVLAGPGTPVKFAEALASGAAVAATADAASGNPDAPAVLSNDPADLAAGIAGLLREPARAAALGAASRAYALSRCTWPATQAGLVEWVVQDQPRPDRQSR